MGAFIDLSEKERCDRINAKREAEMQAGIAKRKAARKPELKQMRQVAVSRGRGKDFDKAVAKYGEDAVVENDYIRSVAMGNGFELEDGRFLW